MLGGFTLTLFDVLTKSAQLVLVLLEMPRKTLAFEIREDSCNDRIERISSNTTYTP